MNRNNVIDYLIVGQGIAGSLLAWMLMKKGKKILVIDSGSFSSSSQIAAGLVHPITGRRLVKTWMADIAFPYAFRFYQELEKESGTSFFHPMTILEIIQTAKQWNDWTARKSDPEIEGLIGDAIDEGKYKECLQEFLHFIPVQNSGWLNIPGFLFMVKNHLKDQEAILEDTFDINLMHVKAEGIEYKNIRADKIIFCEGYKISDNPIWSWVPMLPAKGEILTIEAPGLPQENILLKKIFIVPIGNELFRVGATYSWSPLDEITTEGALHQLTSELDATLKIPYRVVNQKAGVRPTVKDRRPLLGKHPEFEHVYLFNGLGTKGVSLGPYFAQQLIDHVENNSNLHPEVDIRRFYQTFKKINKE